METRNTFLGRHPLVALVLLIVLIWYLGPSLLRAAANVIENPLGCPPGYSAQGDRYDYCERNP